MTANTLISDVNELHIAFVLANRNWAKVGADAQNHYNKRIGEITKEEAEVAIGRAEKMAQEFLKWAYKNKYTGGIKGVWWTSKPGAITRIVGREVPQNGNPADVLVQFSSGPADGYLGISAKSTSSAKKDIAFKNPGIGTIDKILKLNLVKKIEKVTEDAVKKLSLPESAEKRKAYLRSNPGVRKQTIAIGDKLLMDLRDDIFECYSRMKPHKLVHHMLDEWLDAEIVYPPYVKITGKGEQSPFTAEITHPYL